MTQLESCVPTLFRNSSLSEFLQVCNPRTSQPFLHATESRVPEWHNLEIEKLIFSAARIVYRYLTCLR